MTADLVDSFARLVPHAPPGRAGAAARDLLARWAQPHRRYHTTAHLVATLRAVDTLLGPGGPAIDRTAIELAVWFHDAVYDGRPGADEEASAVLAEDVLPGLGVPPDQVVEVARLVRLTAGHDPGPADVAGQVLVDADLSVLAGAPADYRAYADAVRAEYAHVPDAAFRAGRADVLRRLAGGPLFRTPRGRTLWDPAARANLAAELATLTGPTDEFA